MQTRLDGKLTLLYTLLVLQVLIVMIYVATAPPPELTASTIRNSVSFVKFNKTETPENLENVKKKLKAYESTDEKIILKESKTQNHFTIYNKTICWKDGVDDAKTKENAIPEKCICRQGWHGTDCGQPEVVWRAIMASKQNVRLKRRKMKRRIIYTFSINDYNWAIAEVIVEELFDVVDLFVICDFDDSEDNYRHKLSKGLLQAQQKKILYINSASALRKPRRVLSRWLWEKIKNIVRNLRDDDVFVTTEPEQILNKRALMFLKVYEDWPQPIAFRLRWSVYGFYWQHPQKAIIVLGASTAGLTDEANRSNSPILRQELADETNERETIGLVIGDLNHYGGWYCYMCQTPANVVTALKQKIRRQEFPVAKKSVDVTSVEDLIGTGVWLDGKTNLLRASKSREPYFAPETVLNNTWKYDWLVENFYAKLDYY